MYRGLHYSFLKIGPSNLVNKMWVCRNFLCDDASVSHVFYLKSESASDHGPSSLTTPP